MILLTLTSAYAIPPIPPSSGTINPGGTGIINCNYYSGGACTVFTVNTALTTIGGLTPVLNKVIIGDGGTPSAWTVSASALGTGAYATIANYLPLAGGTMSGTLTGAGITATSLSVTAANGSRSLGMTSNTTYTCGAGEDSIFWAGDVASVCNNGVSYMLMTKAVAEYDNGTCTTSKTISAANGNRQKVLLTNDQTCALSFTQPAVGTMNILLKITQSGTSSYNGAISGGKWPGGVVPTITATTGAVDIVSCYLDGTNAYCVPSQDFR